MSLLSGQDSLQVPTTGLLTHSLPLLFPPLPLSPTTSLLSMFPFPLLVIYDLSASLSFYLKLPLYLYFFPQGSFLISIADDIFSPIASICLNFLGYSLIPTTLSCQTSCFTFFYIPIVFFLTFLRMPNFSTF